MAADDSRPTRKDPFADRLCRWADVAWYCGLVPIGIVLTFAALICHLVEFRSAPEEAING